MGSTRRWTVLGALLVMLGPTRVTAQESMRLEYASEVARCPDASTFRELVTARLGRDPFADETGRALRVAITMPRRGRVEFRVGLIDANGASLGVRRLDGRLERCADAAESAALIAAVAIDPLAGGGGGHSAMSGEGIDEPASGGAGADAVVDADVPSGGPSAEAPSARRLDDEPPPAAQNGETPTGEPLHLELGAEAVGRAWLAPNPMLGGAVRASLRARYWSAHVGGGWLATLADFENAAGDRIAANVAGGFAGGCARVEFAVGCLSVLVGTYQGYASTVSSPTTQTSLYAEVEVEAGIEWFFAEPFGLRAVARVAVSLVRVALAIDGSPVFTQPPASAGLGLGVFARVF